MPEETKLKLGMTKDGKQILFLGNEMKIMEKMDVNNLIAGLQTGEINAQIIRDAYKAMNTVLKEYNGSGIEIKPKLKTAEEAKEIPDETA
jgi:hypothetical protein